MSGKQKRPQGLSSGRKSSMIKGYVKGGSFVKPFLSVESTCSGASKKYHRPGGFPSWLNWLDFGLGGFLTKIVKSTFRPTVVRSNSLIMSHFYLEPSQTGFKVDSPVKKPRASEMPRSAPPYTDWALEEPWEGEAELKLFPGKLHTLWCPSRILSRTSSQSVEGFQIGKQSKRA
jgi:hypothetical protein